MSELFEFCAECGRKCYPEDLSSWADFEVAPIVCECGAIYWIKMTREQLKIPVILGETMPELSLGTAICIENREHPLHGKIGQIIGIKPAFYRVLIENKRVWVPTHWIKTDE